MSCRTFVVLFVSMVLLGACSHPPTRNRVESALQDTIQDRSFEIVETGPLTAGYLPVKVRFTDPPEGHVRTSLYKVYPDGFGNWKAVPGSSRPLRAAVGS